MEISLIFISDFLNCTFTEEIKLSSQNWFSPWGFFQGSFAKNICVKLCDVHVFISSLLIVYSVFKLFKNFIKNCSLNQLTVKQGFSTFMFSFVFYYDS